jgi:hypothetical protein
MHGIEELTEDTIDSSVVNLHLTNVCGAEQPSSPAAFSLPRATRVSLTMRYVPKVRPTMIAYKAPGIFPLPLPTVRIIRL